MFENIIFALMVVIALGAGIITCIYEVAKLKEISKKQNKNKIDFCCWNSNKTTIIRRIHFMNIFLWILIFIGGTVGALSTLYIIISLFAVIFYKIYRKIKYQASIYD